MPAPVRTVRVAAVQVQSLNGEVHANLARAVPLVADAAARGAELVLCPEFLAAGYIYDESIWRSGEPQGGPTEAWLRRQATEHGIYIGASYLEADGDEFFNTFTLCRPDGSVAGRVRKESLPGFEGWYFRSCTGPKVIDTELGRIAVGICQDNHTSRFMQRLCRDEFDLVLMPHSAPCCGGRLASRLMRDNLAEIAPFHARTFGVPTVLANKVISDSRSPMPLVPFLKLDFHFPGLSTICDSDGTPVERLGDEPGVAVADVRLDPSRKRRPAVPSGYWSRPPLRLGRAVGALFMALEHLGKRAYGRNLARARAARAVGPATAPAPEPRAARTSERDTRVDATGAPRKRTRGIAGGSDPADRTANFS